MKKTVALLFFVGLNIAFPSGVQADEKAHIAFSKGMVAFSDSRYEEALKWFETAHRKNPADLDSLYMTALGRQKLGRFYDAERNFLELFRKEPDYLQAFYDYATNLYYQKRYGDSFDWFLRAYAADPKNPAPLFFMGTIKSYLDDKTGALTTLRQFLEQHPKHPLAETAQLWIAELEGTDIPAFEIPPPAPAEKKWSIRGAASFFYDTNATFDPDDENLAGFNTNQEDMMGAGALDVSWRLLKTNTTRLDFLYSGYQSAYGNMNVDDNRFNYGRHIGGFNITYKIRDNIQWRMPLNYTFVTLGMAKYSQSGDGTLALDVGWKKYWMTSFYATARHDQYFATPSSAQQNRDAWRPAGGLDQYFFFPGNLQRFLKVGVEYAAGFASGMDWDYRAWRLNLLFNSPLFWRLNLSLLGDIMPLRKFENVDSVFGVRRGDLTMTGSAVLSRSLTPWLNAALSYTFSRTDSNIARFTYTRQLAGITFSTRF